MKYLFLLIFSYFLATAQTPPEANATTSPVQGITYYYLSTPAKPFDVLGTFKVKQRFTGEPKEQIETARKLALDKYPTANAIVFTDLNMQEAQAVRIK